MQAIGVHLNTIQRDILKKNLEKLEKDLISAPFYEFDEEYICWTPMEHAKLNLKHANMFHLETENLCKRIYHLVRDYTLFHAISNGELEIVNYIINHHFEELDLNRILAVERVHLSLFDLGKIQYECSSLNSAEIYSHLLTFRISSAHNEQSYF